MKKGSIRGILQSQRQVSRAANLLGKSAWSVRYRQCENCAEKEASAGRKISADRCATEDKIFDKCGLEKPSQQAETGNPPPDGIFCCHFNQEGIACKSYTKFDIPKVCADQNFKPQECFYRLTLFEVKTTI